MNLLHQLLHLLHPSLHLERLLWQNLKVAEVPLQKGINQQTQANELSFLESQGKHSCTKDISFLRLQDSASRA
jgi:hypothetical protein